MKYNSDIHHRRSIRLKEYDYSKQGCYFVTICTINYKNYFGKIVNDKMNLSKLGEIIENQWLNINNRHKHIRTDKYTIMPNHIHGIIVIENVGLPLAGARNTKQQTVSATNTPILGEIIGSFKSLCINDWLKYIKINNIDAIGKFWQRNYYEHIVRNEDSYNEICKYIINNVINWKKDKLYKLI